MSIRNSEEVDKVHKVLKNIRGFTVRASRCQECLFTKNRLVEGVQAAAIIRITKQKDTYFACHEYTNFEDEGQNETTNYRPTEVCCRAYYDEIGVDSQPVRMAKIMGIVKFVDENGNIVNQEEEK